MSSTNTAAASSPPRLYNLIPCGKEVEITTSIEGSNVDGGGGGGGGNCATGKMQEDLSPPSPPTTISVAPAIPPAATAAGVGGGKKGSRKKPAATAASSPVEIRFESAKRPPSPAPHPSSAAAVASDSAVQPPEKKKKKLATSTLGKREKNAGGAISGVKQPRKTVASYKKALQAIEEILLPYRGEKTTVVYKPQVNNDGSGRGKKQGGRGGAEGTKSLRVKIMGKKQRQQKEQTPLLQQHQELQQQQPQQHQQRPKKAIKPKKMEKRELAVTESLFNANLWEATPRALRQEKN